MTPIQRIQRKLLSGDMICEVTDPLGYALIQEHRETVETPLRAMGYSLFSMGNNTLYMLIDGDEETTETIVRQRLARAQSIEIPLISLLSSLMRAVNDDQMLTPGFVLKKDQIVVALNENEAIRRNLDLAVGEFSKARRSENATLLGIAFKKMEEEGYLVLEDPEREYYKITGKISFIDEVIQFIADYENLDVGGEEETDTAEQEELEL